MKKSHTQLWTDATTHYSKGLTQEAAAGAHRCCETTGFLFTSCVNESKWGQIGYVTKTHLMCHHPGTTTNTASSTPLSVRLQNKQQKNKTGSTPSSLNLLAFNDHGTDSVSRETCDLTLRPGLWNEELRSMTQIRAQQLHPGHQRDKLHKRRHVFCLIGGLFWVQSNQSVFCSSSFPPLVLLGESLHKNRKNQNESISVWDVMSLLWSNTQYFKQQV